MQDIQSIGNGVGSLFGGSLKCPRCGSLNTKFCYYNNYNLSQPRFLCKGCRRYWTKGGVLRNVPVGGGTRKTKRSKHKVGNGKSNKSQNSSSNSSIVAPNILPETTPAEVAPVLEQCSSDNHQLFSELGTFMASSSDVLPVDVSSVTQQRDQDQVVEKQRWNREEWLQGTDKRSEVGSSDGGVAVEDWALFDQSYWFNNSDNQLNYFL